MRIILGVGRVTPIAALYGELSWIPPYVKQRLEAVKVWLRLFKLPAKTLTKKIFNHDQELALRGRLSQSYEIKVILESATLDIWNKENTNDMDDKQVLICVQDS